MFKVFAVAVSLVTSLSACTTVNHVPLTPETSAKLAKKSVTTSQYPKSDFAVVTVGNVLVGGLIGALAQISTGNELVKKNGVEDPAVKISKGLAERLASTRGVTVVANGSVVASRDEVPALLAAYPKADYLLDIKTFMWKFNYFRASPTTYALMYQARLRLIDTSTQAVIAETMCTAQTSDKGAPTYQQFAEDDGTVLRQKSDEVATVCIEVLARDVLKL